MDYERILRNLEKRGYIPYFVKTKEKVEEKLIEKFNAQLIES